MGTDRPHVRQLTKPSGKPSRPTPYLILPSAHLLVHSLRLPLYVEHLFVHHTRFSLRERPLAYVMIDRRDEKRKTYRERSPFSKKRSQRVSPRPE